MTTALSPGSGDAAAALAAPQRPADAFVAFGITGDLAKVMTFRSLYRLEQRGLLDCPIIGVAVDDWTVEDLADRARSSIIGTGETLDEDVFQRFASRLSYVSGDFGDPDTFERVRVALGGARTPVFYLEIPPFLFGTVVKGLADAGLTKGGARAVVDHRHGRDPRRGRVPALRLKAVLRVGRLRRPRHVRARPRRARRRANARLLPRDPAVPVRDGRQGPGRRRPDEGRRAGGGRSSARARPSTRTCSSASPQGCPTCRATSATPTRSSASASRSAARERPSSTSRSRRSCSGRSSRAWPTPA